MHGIANLIAVARAYADAEGIELSTVSSRVFDDSKKLPAIAEGRADIQLGRYEAAMAWFAGNWPRGARWPKGVPRPSIEAAE